MTLQEHVKRITAPYMNRPGNDLNSSWSRMAALTCRPWQWFLPWVGRTWTSKPPALGGARPKDMPRPMP